MSLSDVASGAVHLEAFESVAVNAQSDLHPCISLPPHKAYL